MDKTKNLNLMAKMIICINYLKIKKHTILEYIQKIKFSVEFNLVIKSMHGLGAKTKLGMQI